MTDQLAACFHDHVRINEWDYGRCAETGYHDCGTEITCLDCGDVFDDAEFRRELDCIADECEALRCGTLLEAPLGLTIEVLDVQNGEVIYRTRDGDRIIGPLTKAPLPLVVGNLRRHALTRLEAS